MKKNLIISTAICLVFIVTGVRAQFQCGDNLNDSRDGHNYATVKIGNQCWMRNNLQIGTSITSNSTSSLHFDMTNNSIIERYPPNGDVSQISTFGALYEWPELMNYSTVEGSQGICPSGWHVPSDSEWQQMINVAGASYVSANLYTGSNYLKPSGEGVGTGVGTDAVNFTARAAGDRDAYGVYYGLGVMYIYWTSSLNTAAAPWHYAIEYSDNDLERLGDGGKENGFSCRCVKNAENNGPKCEGQTVNLYAQSIGGGVSYYWIGPNGFTSTSQNPSISAVTTAAEGVYTVYIYDSSSSTIATGTTYVSINENPIASIVANSPCEGANLNLVSTPSYANVFSWTGPGGYTSSLASPTRLNSNMSMQGLYTLNMQNSGTGCNGSSTVNVTIKSRPNTTPSNNSPICDGDALNMTTTGSSVDMSYQWHKPAYTWNTQSCTDYPSTSTIYTVIVTNNSNLCSCLKTLPGIVNYCGRPLTTGLNAEEQIGDLNKFLVYPVPGNKIININFTVNHKQDCSIEIRNLLGELVYEQVIKGFEGEYYDQFNIENYKNGVYFVKVRAGTNVQNQRIVIEH